MTKSELIERLSARSREIGPDDVRMAVNSLLMALTQCLAKDNRVEIRGFGTFHVRSRNPRIGRNPSTGQPIAVERKYIPHFKMGKELRERVDRSRSFA